MPEWFWWATAYLATGLLVLAAAHLNNKPRYWAWPLIVALWPLFIFGL